MNGVSEYDDDIHSIQYWIQSAVIESNLFKYISLLYQVPICR